MENNENIENKNCDVTLSPSDPETNKTPTMDEIEEIENTKIIKEDTMDYEINISPCNSEANKFSTVDLTPSDREEIIHSELMNFDSMDYENNLSLFDSESKNISTTDKTSYTTEKIMNNDIIDLDAIMDYENEEDVVKYNGEVDFTYTFKNIFNISRKYSSNFYARNMPWRILFQRSSSNEIGFFVECAQDEDSNFSDWSCKAAIELKLTSHTLDGKEIKKEFEHNYTKTNNDWGFSRFLEPIHLKDFVFNDTLTIHCHLEADIPHGGVWDSRFHTGYVGLKNQGATCYMNSLLQTLYFTNSFRKILYKLPTEFDESQKSVEFELQKVFYDLQYSSDAVSTINLTKSFGWETNDSLAQHDVQEFLRVLLDKLEIGMKNTTLDGSIPRIFGGKMLSFISCNNVNFESRREETFYDIQLNVKGFSSIYESFENYTKIELLEGENKYDAGQYGLQDAKKGVRFVYFPPVLHLHLMRFQYDPEISSTVKFNDYYEFYDEINLKKYLTQDINENCADDDYIYKLHAVLVHSGCNSGGHYIVYIDPKLDGNWCKFDDDIVSKCSITEAINKNYGFNENDDAQNEDQSYDTTDLIKGDPEQHKNQYSLRSKQSKKHNFEQTSRNAYMLVYIRKSDIKNVLQNVDISDIPDELVARFKTSISLTDIEMSQMIKVHTVSEEDFEAHEGYGLYDPNTVKFREFLFNKDQNTNDLKSTISSALSIPEKYIKFWIIKNDKYILECPAINKCDGIPVTLRNLESMGNPLVLYVQIDTEQIFGLFGNISDIMIINKGIDELAFLKFYDAKEEHLYYIGQKKIQHTSTINDLFLSIKTKLYHSNDVQYNVYYEINDTLKKCDLNDKIDKIIKENAESDQLSNFLIFVFEISTRDELDTKNCIEFFNGLSNRISVKFIDIDGSNDVGFYLNVSLSSSYQYIAKKVAKLAGTHPEKLRFYNPPLRGVNPHEHPIDYFPQLPIINNFSSLQRCNPRLFYQKLSFHISEVNQKIHLRINFMTDLNNQREKSMYLEQTDTIGDLLQKARNEFILGDNDQLRLVEIINNRVFLEKSEETCVFELKEDIFTSYPASLRVEKVPSDQLTLSDDEMLIGIENNIVNAPFFVKIKNGESYSEVKERIQKTLCFLKKDIDINKCKLFKGYRIRRKPANDDDTVSFNEIQDDENPVKYLFLDQANKITKRSSYAVEKPIRFYN